MMVNIFNVEVLSSQINQSSSNEYWEEWFDLNSQQLLTHSEFASRMHYSNQMIINHVKNEALLKWTAMRLNMVQTYLNRTMDRERRIINYLNSLRVEHDRLYAKRLFYRTNPIAYENLLREDIEIYESDLED